VGVFLSSIINEELMKITVYNIIEIIEAYKRLLVSRFSRLRYRTFWDYLSPNINYYNQGQPWKNYSHSYWRGEEVYTYDEDL